MKHAKTLTLWEAHKMIKTLLSSAAIIAATTVAQAGVVRVDETNFTADAGIITFSEFALNTSNPVYSPADYGGDADAVTVSFGGFFTGQSLSANAASDCPGAAATACVVGSPTASLSLDINAPQTYITSDGANPTSPVLSGYPRFNGPVAALFSEDLVAVGFDGGFFDNVGSTGITAFARDGSLLGTVSNEGTGIEFLGLVSDTGSAQIAGVFLDLIGAESAGFAIDNMRFGRADEVILPPDVAPVPLPAALPMALFGLAALGGVNYRRKRS